MAYKTIPHKLGGFLMSALRGKADITLMSAIGQKRT